MTTGAGTDCEVLIIGAGAAGLAAAELLASAGQRNVVVLEARNRLGGRILTDRSPSLLHPVELGAEFIHGYPPESWNLIHSKGLVAYHVPDHHWTFRAGRARLIHRFWEKLDLIFNRLRRSGTRDRSFQEFLRETFPENQLTEEQGLALAYVEGFHAADSKLISERAMALEERRSRDLEPQQASRLVDGQDQLIRALEQQARAGGVRIDMNSPVQCVRWQDGLVEATVFGPEGNPRHFSARKMILTLPPPLLRHIRFEPDLTEKQEAIAAFEMGSVIKIALFFKEPFWHALGLKHLGYLHAPELPLPTWWTLSPLPDPVLFGWAGGPAATALSREDPSELLEHACHCISLLFRCNESKVREQLQGWRHHDWQQDPYARGAYAYVRAGALGSAESLGQPVAETLFFAGEATTFSGLSGTVEAALVSGRRAAIEVLQSGRARSLAA